MRKRISILLPLLAIVLCASGQNNGLNISLIASTSAYTSTEDDLVLRRGDPLVLVVSLFTEMPWSRADLLFDYPDSMHSDPALNTRLDSIFAPIRISEDGQPWHSKLLVEASVDSKRPFNLTLCIVSPLPLTTSHLIPSEPLLLFYGLDPENSRNIKSDKFSLRVGLPTPVGDTVWSNRLSVSLIGKAPNKAKEMSKEELLLFAGYWLRRGDCNKAEPFTSELMSRDSSDYRVYVLLTDVAECQGDLSLALQYCRKALRLFQEQANAVTEPPELLFLKLVSLQNRLMGVGANE